MPYATVAFMNREVKRAMRNTMTVSLAFAIIVSASLSPTQAVAATKVSKQCQQLVVAGHRGKHYPAATTDENTLKAFKDAKKAGTTLMEIDSWNTSDGVPVVVHDQTWKRTIDPGTLKGVPAKVNETTFAQVQALRTKGGEKVPTLQQAIQWAGTAKVTLMVEIKWGFTDPGQVAAWVKQYKASVWFYQSPHAKWHNLTGVEAMQQYGMVTGVKMQDYYWLTPQQLHDAGYTFVAMSQNKLTKATVQAHHALGIKVYPKNSSKKAEWQKMYKAGVDGIIASNPVKLAKWKASGCK